MVQLSLVNQLSLLNTLCFSFLIFVTSLGFSREYSLLRPFGACFFVPFIISVASLLYLPGKSLLSILSYPELGLILVLTPVLTINLKEKQYNVFRWLVPFIPIFMQIPLIKYLLNNTIVIIIVFSACTSASLISVHKRKLSDHLLIGALFSLLAAGFLKIYAYSLPFALFSLVFSFFAYLFFYAYLHGEISKQITQKVSKAEKVLYSIQRTMDLEVKKRTQEIERSNQMLIKMSKTDELTKGYNKTAILNEIDILVSAKNTKEFSILMFDIDKFKPINDTYGHPIGDKCIRRLAQIARISIRDLDSFGRFGGDEFIIVLPGVSTPEAKIVAERFRRKVEESSSPHFSVSIGIATYPYDGINANDLVISADKGLYLSKAKGGNIISHYNSRTA